MDRGTKLLLPPGIQSVPALLLVNDKYRVVVGEDIYAYLNPQVKSQNNAATGNNGEPSGFLISNMSTGAVVSEQYTYFNMSPEELSSKGRGGMRQMHNYVPATLDHFQIPTPEETYRSDKIGNVSMESLQQKRNEDILSARPPIAESIDSIGSNGLKQKPVYAPQQHQQMPPQQHQQMPPQQHQQMHLMPRMNTQHMSGVNMQGESPYFVNI